MNSPEIVSAAENGDLPKVKLLLAQGVDPDTKDLRWGFTALHSAAGTGNEELVILLLEEGAGVNASDVSGATPLHEAAKRGHLKVPTLLLAHGAYVSQRTSIDQLTPLQMAVELSPNETMAALLRAHGATLKEEPPVCVHCGQLAAGRLTELYDWRLGVIRIACENCDNRLTQEFHRRVAADERLPNGSFRYAHSLDGYSQEQLARAIVRIAVCVFCGKPPSERGFDSIWYAPMNAMLIECRGCLTDIKARRDYTGTRYEQELIASLTRENRENAVLRFK
jgi:microcompartment protein CcmK/EutM